jgi:hypothetical protein
MCKRGLCNMKTSERGYRNMILNHYKYLLKQNANKLL